MININSNMINEPIYIGEYATQGMKKTAIIKAVCKTYFNDIVYIIEDENRKTICIDKAILCDILIAYKDNKKALSKYMGY